MNNISMTTPTVRNNSYVVVEHDTQGITELNKLSTDLSMKLANLQQKAVIGELSTEDVEGLDNEITKLIAKLPPELQDQLKSLKQDCNDITESSHEQLSATANKAEHEKITNGALKTIIASGTNVKDYMSKLEIDLMLPFSVISMQVLSSSSKVMADQAKLACDKMEVMTKLIEKLQAMTTLLSNLSAKLNQEYSRKAAEDAQSGSGAKDNSENTTTWDNVSANGAGQTHPREYIDIDAFLGTHGAFDPTNFYEGADFTGKQDSNGEYTGNGHFDKDKLEKGHDPFGAWLFAQGILSVRYKGLCGAGNKVFINPEAIKSGKIDANGRIYLDKFSPQERTELKKYLELGKVQGSYTGWVKDCKYGTVQSDFPDFYDENGKKVDLNDKILADGIIFDSTDIPEELVKKYLDNDKNHYGLYSSKDKKAPTHFVINKDVIAHIMTDMLTQYGSVMGAADDFNEKLTGGVTGTIKQLDNISKIMQQKIQYIQQKQAALAKTPENAKEDGNRKLDMFNNLLRSTSY